ncbi:MAG TPA: amino acid permease [Kofleriaceae bacterium]|jgi:APA family basic amino acid/polyamine antiporter
MVKPKRQLGIIVTAAIVIANMIGTGVFTTSGFSAASLHDPMTIILTWIVGGVVALCGAAAYAELGVMMPRAGGEYVYLRETFHPTVGFMSGWVSLTAGFSAPIAASALVFAAYLATLFPALHAATPWLEGSVIVGGHHLVHLGLGAQQAIAIALICGVTTIHLFDTKIGGRVQAVLTAAKVLLIIGFIVAGLTIGHGDWGHFAHQNGGFANIGTKSFAMCLMYVAFAYSGWNAAAYIASDVVRPEKTLPRALLLGTGIVMVLYVVLNIVFFYAVPSDVLATGDHGGPIVAVGDAAARSLFGDSAGQFVTCVIALALVSAVSAMMMAGPRVYAAMAKDHALPHVLAKHSDRGVPQTSILVQCVLGILFTLVGDPDTLVRFVGFTLALSAGLTVCALFVQRARGRRVAYRTWGYPVTPLIFVVMSAWIAYAEISAAPRESAWIFGVLGIGGVFNYIYRQRFRPVAPTTQMPEARVVSDRDDDDDD